MNWRCSCRIRYIPSIPVKCKPHHILPHNRDAHRVCRDGVTRPDEAGKRAVALLLQGVGAAVRSCSSTRFGSPYGEEKAAHRRYQTCKGKQLDVVAQAVST